MSENENSTETYENAVSGDMVDLSKLKPVKMITGEGGSLVIPVKSGREKIVVLHVLFKDGELSVRANGGNYITTAEILIQGEAEEARDIEELDLPFDYEKMKRIIADVCSPYSAYEICEETKIQKWTYMDEPVDKNTFSVDVEAFTYVLTTKTLGPPSKYIGFKRIDERGDWYGYIGSSEPLKAWIKENGSANIRRKILSIHEDENEARFAEESLLDLFSARGSALFFNQYSTRRQHE